MIKVASFWEMGWNTPLLEYDLWRYPAYEFEVDELIMSPISGIQGDITEYNNIEEIIQSNNGLTIVFVDENGEQELKEFEHPENAIYIFGKSSYSPLPSYVKKEQSIKVKTPTDRARMWGHQVMCLVLNDRVSKQ